ncbi:acyl-protein synthetase [Leclercia adecarboxylata]|uniref:LuxE/PaaK family acyltransferase n=1 Tax=Leclercia adecarboxylata TaxID=83655 RepID=UPI000980D0A4|nr:acyl-protein synthetase [Leclercia adecarboxylata]OOB84644.1 acyl-protein synthetase [Leclercia adecarboxylata]
MREFDAWLAHAPYAFTREEKRQHLMQRLSALTELHKEHCEPYRNILQGFGYDSAATTIPEDIPFLPVALFKTLTLKSVPDESVVKTMTSSGTTGQAVSRIFLDKTTATHQQKTLVRIVSHFTGAGRLPMLIIDTPAVMKDRNMFSARGAGILGFSMFGSERCWALTESMDLDIDGVSEFLARHEGKPVLLFGFTFMIWQHFYQALKASGRTFNLSNGILIHGGGWKKLHSQAVSSDAFAKALLSVSGLNKIYDYYGMVEQTGCIYMQCEYGHLHASIFSDVIIRDPRTLSVCPQGRPGIIQVLSILPESYPGHSLLTEDEGMLLGEDDCRCGRAGKYFHILGRLKNAEIRGCSDTYASEY